MWLTRLLAPVGALMVVAGTVATASGPHAGGRGTGDPVNRLYIKGNDTLSWAVDQHTMIGAIFGLLALIALGTAWYRGATRALLVPLATLVVILGVQGILGAIQYQSQLPAELVWVHVCTATITWLVVLWSWSAAGSPRGREPEHVAAP
jgi:cytochrome c oxidase assembly protein subunit 15